MGCAGVGVWGCRVWEYGHVEVWGVVVLECAGVWL